MPFPGSSSSAARRDLDVDLLYLPIRLGADTSQDVTLCRYD